MTTLIDDVFGQVSRAMAGGASGSEAFTLLLPLLVTHFDRVDTGEGHVKMHTFGVCNGTPFLVSGGSFACQYRQSRGASVICVRRRMWCWGWFGWR